MGFENPAYLWGALAGVIPVLLHLIMRRRAKVVEFAALEFILLSNKRIARRLKLRQWLLLALRVLLISALPLAFSKPYLTHEANDTLQVGAGADPVSVVLVMDPSFSMRYRVGGKTLLSQAKTKALAIIGDLRPESDAAVVVASSPPQALTDRLTYDRGELQQAVEAIEATHASADMQGALRMAEQLLVAAGQPRREVVVLTDMQATEWEGMVRPWSLAHSPGVTLVDLSAGRQPQNVAITRVVAEPETAGFGRDVRVTVDVLNDRPQRFEDVVTVKLGQKTAKGILRVPPGETGTKSFTVRVPEGGSPSGVVEIAPDALPGDNVHPFVVDFLRRVAVLVVNGSPRTVPHKDETFFLRAALRPARDSGSRISPSYVKAGELTAAQLAWVDVVVLANVPDLAPAQAEALESWVRRGGGLLITGGENVVPETYNKRLKALLPLPVRDLRDVHRRPVFLAAVETEHPALTPFRRMPDASLYTAQTREYLLLETATRADTRILMSYSDGAPALVERRLGEGRLMMLTSTIDRDWTELPFKTSFLPLIQQVMLYLSGRIASPESRDLVVGDAKTIRVGRDVREIEVVRPDGVPAHFSEADLATGEVRFRDTAVAGIYVVRQKRTQGQSEERFAVHVDVRESTLTPTDKDAVAGVLAAGRGEVEASGGATRRVPQKTRGGNLWPLVLISLFVVLGGETWVAMQST